MTGHMIPLAQRDDHTRRHILLVDDEPLVRMAVASMLSEDGFVVTEAKDGEKALDLLRASTDIDLVITDHRMPHMTGLELIAKARSFRPDLRALLMTGLRSKSDELADCDTPQLSKPFEHFQMIDAIKTVFRDSSQVIDG